MKSQISPQDYEQLSAFLDGEMPGTAARNFEARLQREPHLKSALQELQAIRSLVREMPKLRAPRSFALSPDMVTARRPGLFALTALHTMQFSAALSAILLVLVLTGDLFLNRFTPRATFAPAAAPPVLEGAAEMPAEVPSAAEAPAAGALPEGKIAADRTPTPAVNAAAPRIGEAIQADSVPAESAKGAPAATAPSLQAVPGAPKPLPTAEIERYEAVPELEVSPFDEALQPSLPPPAPTYAPQAADGGRQEMEKGAAPRPLTTAAPEIERPQQPLRSLQFLPIEIFLAVVMVFSIFLAIVIRRRMPGK